MNVFCNTHPTFRILLFTIATLVAGCGQIGPLVYTPAQQERIDARDKAREANREAAERERAAEENDGVQQSENEQLPEVAPEDVEDPIQQP